ncbi:MAG: hypothetical protein O7B99_04700 [Planctomycetota bacterium]|nr:hypothetical protein [Planctomycetota bacterium]
MSRGFRALLSLIGVLTLAAFAYAPIFESGFQAEDLRLLVRASTGGDAEPVPLGSLVLDDLYAIDGEGSLLGNLTLAVHARVWSWSEPGASARPFRVEGIVLLLLAAGGLGLFVRRLLLPWTGSEHASAAGLAAVPLLGLHPLAAGMIGRLSARDELLALAISCWAAALFLRGRQDRRFAFTAVAALLCIVAGFAGELALYLPLVLVLAEICSAHRYRVSRERLRTAANTLLIFGVAVALGLFAGAGRSVEGLAPETARALAGFSTWEGAAERLVAAVERIGVLVLPVNTQAAGVLGIALAGAVFLAAIQPALIAARTAPRLWGWLLLLWLTALVASELYGLDRNVSMREHTHAAALVGCTTVMATGLAIASTALTGPRRTILPWAIALGCAVLLHANGRPWSQAANEVAALRADLAVAGERWGRDARMYVIDPPRHVRGVDPLGDALAVLIDPVLSGGKRAASEVRGLSKDAFLALTREREFEDLRRERLVVLFPLAALAAPSDAALRRGGRRQAVAIAPPAPSSPMRSWRSERSPDLNLEAMTESYLRFTAAPGADPSGDEVVRWSTLESAVSGSSCPLVWLTTGDEPIGVADLGASLTWRLSNRVRRIWIEPGLTRVNAVEVRDRPPPLWPAMEDGFEPTIDGEHWLFPRPTTSKVEAAGGKSRSSRGKSRRSRGSFVLSLLSLPDYEYREIAVEELSSDFLRAPGAAAAVAEMRVPVAWHLDWRVEGTTLARSSGRRVGRAGTREEAR